MLLLVGDAALWQRVQALLPRRRADDAARFASGASLRGLLQCLPCACAMRGSHTRKKTRRYRYYVCAGGQQHGWQSCPAPAVSAGHIEQLVLEQIQGLAPDPLRDHFQTRWHALPPSEQVRLVRLLIERVVYDAARGRATITFHADATQILADELAKPPQEKNP